MLTTTLKPTKTIKILLWMYSQSLEGKKVTAFGSFNTNRDTSFRTHVSILLTKRNVPIKSKWVTNPNTNTTYKEYWLDIEGIGKAKTLLKSYGFLNSKKGGIG